MSEVALKEYLDTRLSELEKRFEDRARSFQMAIDKADTSMTLRLAGLNEFKDTYKDLAARLISRSEYDQLVQQVNEMRRTMANRDGRSMTVSAGISFIITLVLGLILTFVNFGLHR